MGISSRWDDRLRLVVMLAAVSLSSLAYRDHFLTGSQPWWRWLAELAGATALLAFALRPREASAEPAWRRRVRWALLATAAAALAGAILSGLQPGFEVRAAVALIIALALFFVARWRPRTAAELATVTGAERQALGAFPWTSRLLASSALILVAAATILNLSSALAGATLWLAGLLLLFWAAWRADRASPTAAEPSTASSPELPLRLQWFLLAVVVAVAVVLRFPLIGDYPALIDADEGRHGMMAKVLLNGEFPNLFGFGWNSFPNGATLVQSVFRPFMDRSWVQIRMSSALIGVVSVLITFFWVRRWWGAVVALLAAFLLAINQEHLYWSRVGYNNIQATAVASAILVTFARVLQRGRWRDYVALGYCVGLSFYTYHASKLFPALLLLPTLLLAFDMPLLVGRHLRGAVLSVFAFALVILPQTPAIYSEWARFRIDTTNRFDTYQLANAYQAGNVRDVRAYLYSHFADSLNVFISVPQNLSLFEMFVAIPLLITGLWMLWQWRDPRHTFVIAWIAGLLLIGSMLCAYPPNKPRLLGLIPVACVIPAVFASEFHNLFRRVFGERGDWIAVPAIIAWLAAAAYGNWFTQFVYMAKLQSFNPHSVMCRKLAALPLPANVYVIGADAEASALHALEDCSVDKPAQLTIQQLAIDSDIAPLPPQSAPYAVVFITRYAAELVPLFRHYYPDAREDVIQNLDGERLMYTFTFEPDLLDKLHGLRATFTDAEGKSWSARASFVDPMPALAGPADAAYPIEARWEGEIWAERSGPHRVNVSLGAVEVGWPAFVDDVPPAESSVVAKVVRGWQPIRVLTTLRNPAERVALSWVRPDDTDTVPIPRSHWSAQTQPVALLGRYFEPGVEGPTAHLTQEQLHSAISFDWAVYDDTPPPSWFVPSGSDAEWIGSVDLPAAGLPLRLEATSPTQVYLNDRLVLETAGDARLSGVTVVREPAGPARLRVRTTRRANDTAERWKLRLLWGDGAGGWTAYGAYRPPLE